MVRAALLCLALCGTAEAQSPEGSDRECPVMEGASASLAERTAEERASFLLERTRSVEEGTRIWSATFALGYLGLAVGQLAALTALSDQDTRIDMAVGAVSSLIGVGSIFLLPSRVIVDRGRVETLAPLAAAGDCAALARMERIFADDAWGEEFGTSWFMHVGSVLFNIGIGLVLGLGYGHWQSGAISAAVGIAVGELQLLTKPTGLVPALAAYRSGEFDAPAVSFTPSVGPSFTGGALQLQFW